MVADARWKSWSAHHWLAGNGIVDPTQVSDVGKGGCICENDEALSGAATAMSSFFRTTASYYLCLNVRVMGGTCGGICTFVQRSGFFGF